MSRDEEPRPPITSRRVGCQRIIARHVRVHDLYLKTANETRKPMRARHVERITQRQRKDVLRRQGREFCAQWRCGRKHSVHVMAAPRQSIRQVGQMPLAAAERPRRTDMQNSQRMKAEG